MAYSVLRTTSIWRVRKFPRNLSRMVLKKRGGTIPNTIDLTSPEMTGRKSDPGHRNKLPSETMTHDFSASRPRWLLRDAGISSALLSCGAVWVIGKTATSGSVPSSWSTTSTMAQGRSFTPSSRPAVASRFSQIGIANNQAWNRGGPCHGFQSFSMSSRCS